jgi:hypothetical protein
MSGLIPTELRSLLREGDPDASTIRGIISRHQCRVALFYLIHYVIEVDPIYYGGKLEHFCVIEVRSQLQRAPEQSDYPA